MKSMEEMMKAAQEAAQTIQNQMGEAQAKLDSIEVEGTAGGGSGGEPLSPMSPHSPSGSLSPQSSILSPQGSLSGGDDASSELLSDSRAASPSGRAASLAAVASFFFTLEARNCCLAYYLASD